MTSPPKVGRRRRLASLVSGGLIALVVVWRLAGRVSPPQPTANAAPGWPLAAGARADVADAGTFQVASAEGRVEAERDGRWSPIKEGDTLTRTDVVRTAAGGRAILRLSAGTEIELRERVEIGLDRLPGGPAVDLRRGKVLARVSGAEALAITSHDTRTANEGPSHFVVRSDEQGRVSVAALSGSARFAAGGRSVKLAAGTESSSEPGGAPTDPERIAEEVLLEVVWPAEEQSHRVDHAEIRGQTRRSSTVTVNGTEAPVGPDGHFTATLPLRDGKNPVEVEAEDLAGRTQKAASTVVRRTRPPALNPEPADLWKQ